ncbi:P-type ATPase (P-ATPase) Superfamily [Thraustotheca clavata]|uniref:P-type ATPase (P-ATPase) Superfamily n=1 Tax=Thraustotheca clavata TaxID=74557 RepID=A0A1V9Z9X8_9STRA|nr:P-type ATPase (P-ATPase) Superfamily [Thraustotheca clavata]
MDAENLCVGCLKDDCENFFTQKIQDCTGVDNGNATTCGELDGSVMRVSGDNYAELNANREKFVSQYIDEFNKKTKSKKFMDIFTDLADNHINDLNHNPSAKEVYDQFFLQYTANTKGYNTVEAAKTGEGVSFVGHSYLPLTNGVGFCDFVWDYSNFNQTWTKNNKMIGPGMQKKDAILRSLIYTQVSISGQALIFVTRTAGINTWFFAEKPCNLLLIAFVFAQIVASIIGYYGFAGYPSDRVAVIGCGGGYLVIAWLWAIVWHFPLDLIKFAVNYVLNTNTYQSTAFNSRINAGHPSMSHARVTQQARSVRASRTVA